MEPKLLQIPVEQIAVIDRARQDMGDLQDLADDLLAHGQLQPGIVRPTTSNDRIKWAVDPDKTPWILVAGGRRYAATCLAGLDNYMALNKGDLSPLQQLVYELHENLKRKNLEWPEEVMLKDRIHALRVEEAAREGRVWTQGDTAKELKETQANTSRDLALAKQLKSNPELAKIESKGGAARAVKYEAEIADRSARVNQTNLLRVRDRLVTADMRTFIRTLTDNSVDLTFTDFPFGIDYNFDKSDRNKYEDSKESLRDLLADIIPQMIRVTKPTGWLALMMGSTNYQLLCDLVSSCCTTHYEYADVTWDSEGRRSRRNQCNSVLASNGDKCAFVEPEDPEWLWYRPNSRNPSMHPELHAQNQYEKICVVNMGQAVLVRKNEGNVLVYDAIYTDRIHEMQRPHGLCVDVVSRLSLGGETVADFCFGSGSALAAAAELERQFIGCDLNPKNLEPALVWVSEHMPKRG